VPFNACQLTRRAARADAGDFANDDVIVTPGGAYLLEQSGALAVQHARYMTLEVMAALSGDPIAGLI
jgi:hypothetical protein